MPRSFKAENKQALEATYASVSELRTARDTGSLGDEVIKMAQAMILCSLPYSQTEEEEITREAPLADGSVLKVTFKATDRKAGVLMPFGADRHLLAWIFDRAIRCDSPYIPLESASEYRNDMQLSTGGSGLRQLAERFERIASLMVKITRESVDDPGIANARYLIIEKSYLPRSLSSTHKQNKGQRYLPGIERYGFQMSEGLWSDIRAHHYAVPRQLWRDFQGPLKVQDMILWLYVRCYSAKTESSISWDSLQAQFPDPQNPRRVKTHAKAAVKYLKTIWPEVNLHVVETGLKVGYCNVPLMPDDPAKGRIRRLSTRR